MPAYAALLEDLGRYGQAAEVYEALAGSEGMERFWVDAARCRELAREAELARRDYGNFLDAEGSPETELYELAGARLRLLETGRMLSLPAPVPEEETEPLAGEEAEEPAGSEAPAAGAEEVVDPQ